MKVTGMQEQTKFGISIVVPCSKARLEALSDGVIAIVLTILVFNLKLPSQDNSTTSMDLAIDLLGLWPNLLTFAISFFLVAIYWSAHHSIFYWLRMTNLKFVWLNFHFLFWLCLIPFSTSMVGKYERDWLALSLYGGNLILIGISLFLMVLYSCSERRLVDPQMPVELVRFAVFRCLFAPAMYLIAIFSAPFWTTITLILYTLIPIFYIMPGFHQWWLRFLNVCPDSVVLSKTQNDFRTSKEE